MHLVSVPPLLAFAAKHPAAKQSILSWVAEVKKAKWTQPSDLKARYATVSILKSRRIVFNLKGNDYRLIVAVACRSGLVFVKFIGTYKEYDLVDADTVEL